MRREKRRGCNKDISWEKSARMLANVGRSRLTLGGSISTGGEERGPLATATSPGRAPADEVELAQIEARCRLKAEGVRWAATRRLLIDEGAKFRWDVAPSDREIHARARAARCNLWMNVPGFRVPELAIADRLAGCFEALADAVALVRGTLAASEARRDFVQPSLDVLAEAQSALRVAIDHLDGPTDADQVKVYTWLRETAARNRIFIRRHLRLDDPADPSSLSGIKKRIETLKAKFDLGCQRAKFRRSRMKCLRYHARLIAEGSGGIHDWVKVADAVGELVSDGIPPSNVELREIVIPILDDMPELNDVPEGFSLALRETDHYLASRTAAADVAIVSVPTPEVIKVAGLLNGKGVVLIGGNRRPGAHDALKSALGLTELVWITTKEHESVEQFEPLVARPDVALVILAIRWSRHSFGDVKRFCERYGKPMVRLPGGYGVNQVAAQIIAQCSGQLGGG